LTTRNHDRSAKVYSISLPPGPTGAHPFRATKLSCHFGKPCLTSTYRLGSKAVRTGTSSANLLTKVASVLANSLTAEAGWKHRAFLHLGPLQKSALRKNKGGFRYYDSNVVSFTSNRCKIDDVSCCPSSYILPVASHLDPSLVSAPDTISAMVPASLESLEGRA
jgi:hypothetical protein